MGTNVPDLLTIITRSKKLKYSIERFHLLRKSSGGRKIIVGTRLYYEEITRQAIALGIPEENIINAGKTIDSLSKKQFFNLRALPHYKGEVFVDIG